MEPSHIKKKRNKRFALVGIESVDFRSLQKSGRPVGKKLVGRKIFSERELGG